MAGHAAVSVDDDLAAGQARVAHRAADDEPARGVDMHDRVFHPQLGRDDRQYHRLDDVGPELLDACVGVVLGGDHHVRDSPGYAVVVLDRDLGLAVGPEVGQLAALANLGQAARKTVGQGDRQRHELGRLAAGEADHHALVAGAQLMSG